MPNRLLFVSNLPSPYKVDFFNELGKYVDLTVAYELHQATNRHDAWQGRKESGSYKDIWLTGLRFGEERSISMQLIGEIRWGRYDLILMNGYSSPTAMIAIAYMRIHRIPFGIICDGALHKKESVLKYLLKRYVIRPAAFYLSPNHVTDRVLMDHGAESACIYRYPFTSVREADLAAVPYDRTVYKSNIKCDSDKMILYVGQMIHRKGIDIFLEAVNDQNFGVYMIGGKLPTEMKCPPNVHIVDFLNKEKLQEYYRAADLFVLPSREDIWGLVVNEAMANAVPVVATSNCGAALEMITDGKNGRVVSKDNTEELRRAIIEELAADPTQRMAEAVSTAGKYTIEKMALRVKEVINLYCEGE